MPNLVALSALLLWPAITAVLFNRLPAGRALIATLIAGYLFLPPPPAALDLRVLPPLTKEIIPILSAMMMVLILHRPGLRLLPDSRIARVLIAMYVLGPVGTVLTNTEPLYWGVLTLPGLNLREMIVMVVMQAITILPLLLGRHFLSRPQDLRDLLVALLVGGLVYSLPMLVEVRLSPQMNVWVYGFFQHSFDQMMRAGGFRPIVFLYHALWVAFFAMTAVVAAAVLVRNGTGRDRTLAWAALAWLGVVLVLCKSYAAMAYALLLVPLVLFFSIRMQIRLAMVMAVFALVYPIAKSTQLFPEDAVVSLAGELGPDRAHTLQYRFDNETVLADRAYEKPLFGWGIWGRPHIHDTATGRILTVTDGRWVLILGALGITGYIAEFGLLALPLILLWRRSRSGITGEGDRWVAPVALLLGVNMVDLVPNATITPLTWFLAGAILGNLERAPATTTAQAAPAAPLRHQPIRTVI